MNKYRCILLLACLLLLGEAIGRESSPNSPDTAAGWQGNRWYDIFRLAFPPKLQTQFSNETLAGNSVLRISLEDNKSVALYSLLEFGLQTSLQATNPYDPSERDLEVSFSAPSGKQVQVGAFWMQDYDPVTRRPLGAPGWKVRFTPDEVGKWEATSYAPALGVHSAPVSFTVLPSERPGFIRINPKNQRYLAFDNGDFFFPIGVNMAWWSEGKDPIAQYSKWLDRFTSNGGNTIRVWMASWSFGIEWSDTGLGDYANRQYEAWLLDQLFRLAAEHGVKIILVLINHGAFSPEVNSEWDDNPYNASSGGPLSSPEQFVGNRQAMAYFKQRLDYIVDRWGYSPDLLAWEWFNEVNLTPITDAALTPWLKMMTAFLDERDTNHHLTTLSFAQRTQSSVWNLPGLDIIQTHEYSSQISASQHDLADRAGLDFQVLASSTPSKPILMGEFGYSAKNYGDNVDKTGIHLHNGLWATTFSGYAGTGMYWWWDIYIDPNNLWCQFKGLASFIEGEDLTHYQPVATLKISDSRGNDGPVAGLALQGEATLVWLRSDAYTVQAALGSQEDAIGMDGYSPPLLKGLYLTLVDLPDGSYRLRWFDPQEAKWLDEQVVTAQNNILVVRIPDFREDLAAKIVPIR